MTHDKQNNFLVVRVELVELYHIQYFNLPDLELKHEVFCTKAMSSYARLKSKVLLGFDEGAMDLVEVKPVETTDTFNRMPSLLPNLFGR